MRTWIGLWIILQASVAFADDPQEAQKHAVRGRRWFRAVQYEKAIEEYEQAYLAAGQAKQLYNMAESYDKMAAAADTAAEVMKSKGRALQLYEAFLADAPATEPELEAFRKTAASRVELLRQEMREMVAQVTVEREELRARLKGIEDKLERLIDHLLPQEPKKPTQRQAQNPPRL